MSETADSNGTQSLDYDAVIVGGSLAGCTAAILLGRAGLRVAVVEKQPDPKAFKRMCTHFIQASPCRRSNGSRCSSRSKRRAGCGRASRPGPAGAGSNRRPSTPALSLNIRREVLDPMLREAAAATPGVESTSARPCAS